MLIPYGGNRVTQVSEELAKAFKPGDRLVVVQETGDLLHIPVSEWEVSRQAVSRAVEAFESMGEVSDRSITRFYLDLADRLANPSTFARIAEANYADRKSARERGRSTTRLDLTKQMRADMIEGLQAWAQTSAGRGEVMETVKHTGWKVDLIRAGLGVVGFVFEGRPNVFSDATGVLRSGNTVVFRIGSDALGTARAIVEHALDPSLAEAGLPPGAVTLVDSPSRAAGWALFSDPRLSLAVARGSGQAVSQLGAVARQSGVPVSLHGTGGGWIIADTDADPEAFAHATRNSLDRKVCNTLNTCVIVLDRAEELVPILLRSMEQAAAARGSNPKLHVPDPTVEYVPESWFDDVRISRAEGRVFEPQTQWIDRSELGREWEWEDSPEVSMVVVDDLQEGIDLFNRYSPRLVASLISDNPEAHQLFFDRINSPFVGNGFTRWVDGQYALNRPELGLSNWELGRLFGRGAVLAGDSVYTVRTRASQIDPSLRR